MEIRPFIPERNKLRSLAEPRSASSVSSSVSSGPRASELLTARLHVRDHVTDGGGVTNARVNEGED